MEGQVVPLVSQERKLKEALHQVGVSHNAGVIAHLANVLVGPGGTVFFCNSQFTLVSEVTPGDGDVVPDRVTLEGSWEFPAPGFYDLRNVRIAVNGTIAITKEAETDLAQVRPLDYRW